MNIVIIKILQPTDIYYNELKYGNYKFTMHTSSFI